jgi:hypothetical protein
MVGLPLTTTDFSSLTFLSWSKACWTPRTSQVFLYLDPYMGLSACIHVSSPCVKWGWHWLSCVPQGLMTVSKQTMSLKTHLICWSSMCGWLGVFFRDLLQWRTMDRRWLCLPWCIHRRAMPISYQCLPEWRPLGWAQVPVHQPLLWTKVWGSGWQHWDR